MSSSGQNTESLAQRYAQAVSLISSSPAEAVDRLTAIQHQVAAQALISAETDTIDDVCTSSLPLLLLEHNLATAYTQLPFQGIDDIATRQGNLLKACDLWNAFLSRLESLEQLTKEERAEYHELLETVDHMNNGANDVSVVASAAGSAQSPPNRTAKIAWFRLVQQAENEQKRLQSLHDRRGRLGVAAEEEMDGHDEEGLQRTLALNAIQMAKAVCMNEWAFVVRELPMIAMTVKSQEQQLNGDDRHHHRHSHHESNGDARENGHSSRSGQPAGPMQLTHITHDATTGQLRIRREDVQAGVFRPGWNQPTMSLEELAHREVAAAMERDERQKEAEAYNLTQPRRIAQLHKDGLEDDADLVDASAALDRQWDDFRAENPRGSGNKRGDVGDRNF